MFVPVTVTTAVKCIACPHYCGIIVAPCSSSIDSCSFLLSLLRVMFSWGLIDILLRVIAFLCEYVIKLNVLLMWAILNDVMYSVMLRVYHSASVLCHKTFHRYVVRAKRGTSQSSCDNKAGLAPKSAGASLRRHNEAALTQVRAHD